MKVSKIEIKNPKIAKPDIDVDLDGTKREMLFDYLVQKFGKSHVAWIGNRNQYSPKSILRDLGQVYDIPSSETFACTKQYNDNISVKENMVASEVVREYFERYPELQDKVERLQGVTSALGIHAGGVVITDKQYPLTRYCALQRSKDGGKIATLWTKDEAEYVGLTKLDLLGSSTVTQVCKARELLGLDPYGDFDEDREVFRNIVLNKFNKNIFQFETPVGKKAFADLMPMTMNDLVATTSVIRLIGSDLGRKIIYERYKRNIEIYQSGDTENWKKILRDEIEEDRLYNIAIDLFKDTYGTLLFQEQIIWFCTRASMGVKTFSDGNLLRKALDKFGLKYGKIDALQGNKEALKVWHSEFMGIINEYILPFIGKDGWESAIPNTKEFLNFELDTKNKLPIPENGIVAWFIGIAGYSFNIIHALAYSMNTYNTMHLKFHHPLEFWTASLQCEVEDLDKVRSYISATQEEASINGKIKVLAPNVNKSEENFKIEKKNIRYGLRAIKGMGKSAEEISNERKRNGKYKSIKDFINRVPGRIVNIRVIKGLLHCNAFSDFGDIKTVWQALCDEGKKLEVLPSNTDELAKEENILIGTNITFQDSISAQLDYYRGMEDIDEGQQDVVIVRIMKKWHKTTKKQKPYILYRIINLSGDRTPRDYSIFSWENKDYPIGSSQILRIRRSNDFYSIVDTSQSKRGYYK